MATKSNLQKQTVFCLITCLCRLLLGQFFPVWSVASDSPPDSCHALSFLLSLLLLFFLVVLLGLVVAVVGGGVKVRL